MWEMAVSVSDRQYDSISIGVQLKGSLKYFIISTLAALTNTSPVRDPDCLC